MRDDMAKMLVETHRSPAFYTYKKCRRTNKQSDQEELPSKQRMLAPYGWNTKNFGENFAPLVGFIRKSVGRPWDDVYSELSKGLTGGGAVVEHVYVHLWQYVTRKPDFTTGKAMDISGYRKPREFTSHEWYVDIDGILREGVDKIYKKKRYPKTHHFDGRDLYLKVKGLWYAIKCEPLPKAEKKGIYSHDLVSGTLITREVGFRTGRHFVWAPASSSTYVRHIEPSLWDHYSDKGTRRATKKQSLNSRTLKRLKLVND